MGNYPQTIQVDATGGFVYVGLRCAYWASSCGSSSLYGFSIDVEDGRLEALPGSPWGTPFPDVMSMTLDARGQYIYIVDGGWSNIASATGTSGFAVNSLTGNLVPMTHSFPFQPAVLAFLEPDPTGLFLYGGNLSANQIEVYGIDTASGALTVKQTLPFTAGGSPWSIAFTWKWE
jgi:6-phosphogluconolactonase (cycloisomerase 2 family)